MTTLSCLLCLLFAETQPAATAAQPAQPAAAPAPEAAWSELASIDQLMANGQYGNALTRSQLLLGQVATPNLRAQLLLRKGVCQQRLGDLDDAFETILEINEKHPYDVEYQKVINLLLDISNDYYNSTKNRFLMFGGSEKKTIEFYQKILVKAPYAKGASAIALRIGLLYQDIGEEESAVLSFLKLIRDYRNSEECGDARILLSQYFINRMNGIHGDYAMLEQARLQLMLFQQQFKDNHKFATIANERLALLDDTEAHRYYELGRFYLRKAHYRPDAARRYLMRVVISFPNTPWARLAEELLAQLDPDYKSQLGKARAEEDKRKAEAAKAARELVPREVYDRSVRRTLILPEDSKGKYLIPVEDLGLDTTPLDPPNPPPPPPPPPAPAPAAQEK